MAEKTIYIWKRKHPEFLQATKDGKDGPDSEVVNALLQRALGYSHPDVDIRQYEGKIIRTEIIKHYPPDTAACFIWLKNRQGWRDKQEFEHSGEVAFTGSLELVGPEASDD